MTAATDNAAGSDRNAAAWELTRLCLEQHPGELAEKTLERSRAIAEIVDELGVDDQIHAAAIAFPFLDAGLMSWRDLSKQLPDETAKLARELVRLGTFTVPENWDAESGLSTQQAETLRKMLLSIIDDVRLVLVRLADQLYRLRNAKNAEQTQRRRVALETREIYAPLANKLGVWQIKWELEDLAFRFLHPETYADIARMLAEKRGDREGYIEQLVAELHEEVSRLGIEAQIDGRPKHIFSIWKKMSRKGVDFDHIFDVRAVRVLVDSVADCYAVLGAVHGRWQYIPGEFDDYIATPKENFYRSLHTAVIGPENKTLEIQIRTHEMHAHAELGVAAHWKYKEGGGADAAFDRKIRWVRSLLEPAEDDSDSESDFIDRFRADLFEDRVYILTPRGDIMDLPFGSTPLDFAYYVHTELGHRCRGAKVNGRIVPLTHKLVNGAQVEIISAKTGSPSRDWLIPQLGYLGSSRARAKVRNWFRRQDQSHNLAQGQQLLDKELARLGVSDLDPEQLAHEFHFGAINELYVALGAGDVTLANIAQAIEKRIAPTPTAESALSVRKPTQQKETGIEIEGVGGLMTVFARCCKPLPPDAIAGYITLGRGVTIHRKLCRNFLRLATTQGDRVLEVNWSGSAPSTYPVDISVEAYDRRGLVKDISSLLSAEKINIVGMNTRTDKQAMSAHFDLTVEIASLEELSRLMSRISSLPNVIAVQRRN